MYHRNDWTPDQDAMLATLSPDEIQRITGRSKKAIVSRRVKLKRKGVKLPDLRTSEQRTRLGKAPWTAEADDLVRRLRPIEVARLVGVSKAAARERRVALGLPPIGKRRLPPKPPRTTPRRVVRKWTKAEMKIALALPPLEAMKRLPGRTSSAIQAIRFQHKRNGVKFPAHKRGRPKRRGG